MSTLNPLTASGDNIRVTSSDGASTATLQSTESQEVEIARKKKNDERRRELWQLVKSQLISTYTQEVDMNCLSLIVLDIERECGVEAPDDVDMIVTGKIPEDQLKTVSDKYAKKLSETIMEKNKDKFVNSLKALNITMTNEVKFCHESAVILLTKEVSKKLINFCNMRSQYDENDSAGTLEAMLQFFKKEPDLLTNAYKMMNASTSTSNTVDMENATKNIPRDSKKH